MPRKKPGPKKGAKTNRKAAVLSALGVLLDAGVITMAQFLRMVRKV